jgi:hypothetical protein
VDLKCKAQALGAAGRWPKVHYALFARQGFTADLQAAAAAEPVRLVTAADLVQE